MSCVLKFPEEFLQIILKNPNPMCAIHEQIQRGDIPVKSSVFNVPDGN